MTMTQLLTLLYKYFYIKQKVNSKWLEISNKHETSLPLYGSPISNIYSHHLKGFA